MSAYLTTYISRTSTLTPDAGVRADVADDGTLLFRRDRASTAFALVIVHEWITQAEYDALVAFIDSNGYGPHTLTLKGIDLVITLINEPEIVDHRGNLFMVNQKALAVRA